MTRKYLMINLHEKMLPDQQGSNPRPPDLQSDKHLTEPPRLTLKVVTTIAADDILEYFF